MNEQRLALFGAVFKVELARAIETHAEEYDGMTVADVPSTVARILPAIAAGSVNKDTPAMRATFRAFGIPHTYKALRAWMEGE